jgi:hypothetical protein
MLMGVRSKQKGMACCPSSSDHFKLKLRHTNWSHSPKRSPTTATVATALHHQTFGVDATINSSR